MTFNGVVDDCKPGTDGPRGLARCRKESVSVIIGGEGMNNCTSFEGDIICQIRRWFSCRSPDIELFFLRKDCLRNS